MEWANNASLHPDTFTAIYHDLASSNESFNDLLPVSSQETLVVTENPSGSSGETTIIATKSTVTVDDPTTKINLENMEQISTVSEGAVSQTLQRPTLSTVVHVHTTVVHEPTSNDPEELMEDFHDTTMDDFPATPLSPEIQANTMSTSSNESFYLVTTYSDAKDPSATNLIEEEHLPAEVVYDTLDYKTTPKVELDQFKTEHPTFPTEKNSDYVNVSSSLTRNTSEGDHGQALYVVPVALIVTSIIAAVVILILLYRKKLSRRQAKSWRSQMEQPKRPLSDILKRQYDAADGATTQLLSQDCYPSPNSVHRPSFSNQSVTTAKTSCQNSPCPNAKSLDWTVTTNSSQLLGPNGTNAFESSHPNENSEDDNATCNPSWEVTPSSINETNEPLYTAIPVLENAFNSNRLPPPQSSDDQIAELSCTVPELPNNPPNRTNTHEYDPVYIPTSCAASMNRLVDNTMYVRRPTFLRNLRVRHENEEYTPPNVLQGHYAHTDAQTSALPTLAPRLVNMGATASGGRPQFLPENLPQSLCLPYRISMTSNVSSNTYDEIHSTNQSERNSCDICTLDTVIPAGQGESSGSEDEQDYAPVAPPEGLCSNDTCQVLISGWIGDNASKDEESIFSPVEYPPLDSRDCARPTSSSHSGKDDLYEPIQFPM